MKASPLIQKAGLITLSVLLSAFIAEGLLRLYYGNQYYVWQPHLKHTFHPDTSVFYGISGPSVFSINRQGLRGNLLNEETYAGNKNILLLGGSTTECLYLDDTETWGAVWARNSGMYVANMGKSGVTTREHYIQVKYALPKHTNLLVVMPGINDLMKQLSHARGYPNFILTPETEDSLRQTILIKPCGDTAKVWWRQTALYHLLHTAYSRNRPEGLAWVVNDDTGKSVQQWRSHRRKASAYMDTLPNLTTALNEYEKNLGLIAAEARKKNIPIVFLNQATLYKDSMSAYEESLLWMGGIGNYQQQSPCAYYTPKALNRGISLYNQRLQKFCSANHITMVDIATVLPADTSVFYDDCHFNENGARLLGLYLAKLKLP